MLCALPSIPVSSLNPWVLIEWYIRLSVAEGIPQFFWTIGFLTRQRKLMKARTHSRHINVSPKKERKGLTTGCAHFKRLSVL